MHIKPNVKKHRSKLLIILGSIIVLIIGFTISLLLLRQLAIDNRFGTIKSQDQFVELENTMKLIYSKFQSISKKDDKLEYTSHCFNNIDQTWNCYSVISIQGFVTTLQEATDWNYNYSSTLTSSGKFTFEDKTYPKDQYGEFGNNNFGEAFTVSDTEKYYLENKSGIECINFNSLRNINENNSSDMKNGAKIKDNTAMVEFDISCNATAGSSWYSPWIIDTDNIAA